MIDEEKRKKVMRGLEAHVNPESCETCAGEDCPYYNEGGSFPILACSSILAADALDLLKEQEAVEPKLYTPEDKTIWSSWHICGACEHPVDPGDKFCRECGRPIKWEEQDGRQRKGDTEA